MIKVGTVTVTSRGHHLETDLSAEIDGYANTFLPLQWGLVRADTGQEVRLITAPSLGSPLGSQHPTTQRGSPTKGFRPDAQSVTMPGHLTIDLPPLELPPGSSYPVFVKLEITDADDKVLSAQATLPFEIIR